MYHLSYMVKLSTLLTKHDKLKSFIYIFHLYTHESDYLQTILACFLNAKSFLIVVRFELVVWLFGTSFCSFL